MVHAAQSLRRAGRAVETLRSDAAHVAAGEGAASRRDLDAGTHQGERGAGRHLSGHGQFDHGAAMPGIPGRRSVGPQGASGNRRFGNLRHGVNRRSAGRCAAPAAVPFSHLGYVLADECAG